MDSSVSRERRNLFSAGVPTHFNWPLLRVIRDTALRHWHTVGWQCNGHAELRPARYSAGKQTNRSRVNRSAPTGLCYHEIYRMSQNLCHKFLLVIPHSQLSKNVPINMGPKVNRFRDIHLPSCAGILWVLHKMFEWMWDWTCLFPADVALCAKFFGYMEVDDSEMFLGTDALPHVHCHWHDRRRSECLPSQMWHRFWDTLYIGIPVLHPQSPPSICMTAFSPSLTNHEVLLPKSTLASSQRRFQQHIDLRSTRVQTACPLVCNNLDSLTLPAPRAGDFVEILLLYHTLY